MTTQFDGFCDECRAVPGEQFACTAAQCGHETQRKDSSFCIPCALKYGACRGCGKIVRVIAAGPRSGEP